MNEYEKAQEVLNIKDDAESVAHVMKLLCEALSGEEVNFSQIENAFYNVRPMIKDMLDTIWNSLYELAIDTENEGDEE